MSSFIITEIANAIKTSGPRSISILSGAGISVASGIPDFRSPGGMYDTLLPELLTASEQEKRFLSMDPVGVVSWDLFQVNPFPYLEVRRPFILGIEEGKWKITLSHLFHSLLERHDKLNKVMTQNIDGLDYIGGLTSTSNILNVHGSLAEIGCEFCGMPQDKAKFIKDMQSKIKDIYNIDVNAPTQSSHIECSHCGKSGVKPTTVLYGRNLPAAFFQSLEHDLPSTEILFVMGTSLTVFPAAGVPDMCQDSTKRIMVNRDDISDKVSSFDTDKDKMITSNCDDFVASLIVELGWLEEAKQHRELLCEQSLSLLDSMT